ncbi:MAG: patatin-like phospholipase family protein [Firmicutes bacterium]|nr:patatin-like phospholipase family protein [Bacillota bacterium]
MALRLRTGSRPRIGLALGAGGLRGLAHIGVIGVLEEAGIHADVVAGTSAGAIVGALYACGWSAAAMRRLAKQLRPRDIFDSNLRPLPLLKMAAKAGLDALHLPSGCLRAPMGVVPGRRLLRQLTRWTEGRQVGDTARPYIAVATVVETGERAVFAPPELTDDAAATGMPSVACRGASVALAARASSAIPGVFEPVPWQGRTLVDGGLVDNVPGDLLKAMGMDLVIGVALGLRGNEPERVDNVVEVVDQAVAIMINAMSRRDAVRGADVVVAPAVPGLSLTRFDAVQATIAAGEAAAREALPAIRAALEELGA